MARQITKELAEKIVRKLGAILVDDEGAHEIYADGKQITRLGIRRGSEKDQGHDHLKKQLRVSPRFAKELAICTRSRENWIDKLIADGRLIG